MVEKTAQFSSLPDQEEIDLSIESTLREFLHPVKPRNEFVNKLEGKLQESVLPNLRKKVLPLHTLAEVFLRTVALFVLTVLTVRALMLIIASWKFIRAASTRS